MINRYLLDSQLMLDEGLRLMPYIDSRGFLTTGVGRNLDGNPLTAAEMAVVGHDGRTLPLTHDQAIFLLHNDEMKAMTILSHWLPWWLNLSDVPARVMVDLEFNMGWSKLQLFHHFLADMQAGDFAAAGQDLQNSVWFGEVGKRGPRLVGMVTTGQDYTS